MVIVPWSETSTTKDFGPPLFSITISPRHTSGTSGSKRRTRIRFEAGKTELLRGELMPDTYKIGDTVVLKSSGPIMTVTRVGNIKGRPSVWCSWFDRDDNEKMGVFPADAVKAAATA